MMARAIVRAVFLLVLPVVASADAVPVELRKSADGWQLYRDGEPYFIRGAGGTGSMQALAEAGANSVRTWDSEGIDDLLDQAHSLEMTVAVGIWLGHERHGFDYDDAEQVAAQKQRARQYILRFKDHPAVLLWGIGNEMEGYESGDNPAIWEAVNDIAVMAKQLDPDHPTMAVTAEIGGGRIDSLNTLAPAIDIHGINAYGGAASIAKRYRAGGGRKPYVLTEFGPVGPWELPKNDWGVVHEPTSAEKADIYRRSYEGGVLAAPDLALGAYAFLWGSKMEATATWFGMILPDGARLAAVDAMTEFWTGQLPDNQSPVVAPLTLQGSAKLAPGSTLHVTAAASDPEEGALRARWALRADSDDYITGGDFRADMADIEGAIIEADLAGATVKMPVEPGPYRLFLYVYDEAGNAATANVPLLVEGKTAPQFPIAVYSDGFENMRWVPSGWMGNVDALTLDGDYSDEVHDGHAAVRLRYDGQFNWVGVAWQNPANNWGEQQGGFDLNGATELELWARGEYGGEKVSFGVGSIADDKPHPDSGIAKLDDVVLTPDWQRYVVPLKGLDLSSIKTGFVVTLTGRQSPVTIYLDSVRFVR